MKSGNENVPLSWFPITDEYYFWVYKKNVEQIGVLPPEIGQAITLCYTLIFSFLDDVKGRRARGEAFVTSDRLAMLEETSRILTGAISEAQKAVSLIEKKKRWRWW